MNAEMAARGGTPDAGASAPTSTDAGAPKAIATPPRKK